MRSKQLSRDATFPWSDRMEATNKIRGVHLMRRISLLSVLVAVGCFIQIPCLSSAAENDNSHRQAASHLRMWDTAMGMT